MPEPPESRPPADERDMTPPSTGAARVTRLPSAPHTLVTARPRNEGHGKRLTAAFEALELFPVLAQSRNRVLALIGEDRPSTREVVKAIESDVALVIAVMRMANGVE